MARAVELARSVHGETEPNPPVGAVIVRDHRIIAEGATRPAGQEHAEVIALRAAGADAKGALLYVTLEPCSHWGRTPPCADAIISAGIREVHVAMVDPNPLVNGEGVRRLQAAGIDVTVGECGREARAIVEKHLDRFRSD